MKFSTQLPKKISYTLYVYMALVILLYFIYMRSTKPSLLMLGHHLQMIAMKVFSKYPRQGNKSDFLAAYRDSHLGTGFKNFSEDLKYEISRNPGGEEVCKWIKEAEQELHSDAKAVYDCILDNFGGSHQVTARIIEPDGSMMAKIKTKIDQTIWPRKVKWYFFTIISMFVVLCLHMFDYVKDIGNPTHQRKPCSLFIFLKLNVSDITAILYHFDRIVVQQAYKPYKVHRNYILLELILLYLRGSTSTICS